MIGVLSGANHYTSPRFWAGPMTAFFRVHLAGDRAAEEFAWGAQVCHPVGLRA